MLLTGKTIAVTGGFGSLGAAVAKALRKAGARVAAIDRSALIPSDFADITTYGGIDLSDQAAAREVFERFVAELDGLDAVVNIAGGFRWEKIEGGSLDTWDFLYKVNVLTAVSAIQAALPHLLKTGSGARVINIGAEGAVKAVSGMGAYAASKAGVAKLTEALAAELKDSGITVNAILPSIIDTPANRADMPDADFSRWVTTSQLAEVIIFLLLPAAQSLTGALIQVTGRV